MIHHSTLKTKIISRVGLSCLLATLLIIPTSAITESTNNNAPGYTLPSSILDFYDANGIYYYDPKGVTECIVGVGSVSGTASAGLYPYQANFVDQYHDIAESLSIQYGIPWEAVVAQGINESDAGRSNFALNRNNFFGIGAFDSNPDRAHYYDTPMAGWRGYFENIRITATYRAHGVFQNNYSPSFSPKPSSYGNPTTRNNITNPYEYLQTIWDSGYASSATYYNNIAPLITAIINRAEEKGWKTTAELAIEHPEMLTNAANNSAGSNSPAYDTTISGTNATCIVGTNGAAAGGGGTNGINATAIELSWAERGHGTTPTDSYRNALHAVGLWTGSGNCEGIGAACDRFLATVMRYSEADPNFPAAGAATAVDYMAKSNLYEEIENLGNTSNLQPGDILGVKYTGGSASGHVGIYVQKSDGSFGVASASMCSRSADIGGYSPKSNGVSWRIFRYIGGS